MTGDAWISDDGVYRYRLDRYIGPTGLFGRSERVLFVMLNPSTADAAVDDPTIRRCLGFARREHSPTLTVVNLYAYRTPHPRRLAEARRAGVDIVGPDNDRALEECHRPGDLVIAAWGARPAGIPREAHQKRIDQVRNLLGPMYQLGLTLAGDPRHPLYLKLDAPLASYR